MSKTFILSVGGSLFSRADGVDIKFLKEFREFILKRVKAGDKFFLISGGGAICRQYNQAALSVIKVNTVSLDWLGIAATRFNAQLLKTIFGPLAYEEIIIDPTKKIKTNKKIIIAAGYKPGWSTDYCAVLMAEHNQAKTVINLSNIDYVYNKDPRKFMDAKKIERATWTEFQKIVGTKWLPGLNAPFDPVASLKAAKNKLEVIIINGRKIKNLDACLKGKNFVGTIIS